MMLCGNQKMWELTFPAQSAGLRWTHQRTLNPLQHLLQFPGLLMNVTFSLEDEIILTVIVLAPCL